VNKNQNPVPEKGNAVFQKTGTLPFQKTGTLITVSVPENGNIHRVKVFQKTGTYLIKPSGVARGGV